MPSLNKKLRRQRMIDARAKGTHTEAEWERMKAFFGGRCVRCGTDEYRVERDHIIPVYQGGSDSIRNLQPVCARCNASKGPERIDHRIKRADLPEEWKQEANP